MKYAAQVFLGCLACIFCLGFPVSAAPRSLFIAADKITVVGDEEIPISASASGFTPGETIYLKGAFFQAGSSNYFGYTKSGDTWIKNSVSNTSQRSVVIGQWDGKLIVKSDFSDSGYKGEGDYNLKVGFYYGSASAVNWSSNILAVTLNESDPTPTNTPTSTTTPTATRTPTTTPPSTPTCSPTVTTTPRQSQVPVVSLVSATIASSFLMTPTRAPLPVTLGIVSDSQPVSRTKTQDKKLLIISLLSVGIGGSVIAVSWAMQQYTATHEKKETS